MLGRLLALNRDLINPARMCIARLSSFSAQREQTGKEMGVVPKGSRTKIRPK